MNNKFVLLFFCLFFKLAWGGDTIVTFHGDKITLSEGYIPFSDEQLMQFKATIFDRQLMNVYERKMENNGIQRIIVYYDSLSGMKNLTFKEFVKLKLEITKEEGVLFDDVKIDKKNHCLFGRAIVKGDTSILGFSIDGFGIMGIQMDNSKGISFEDKENFERMITSIQHRSGYEYLQKENPKANEAKKQMSNNGLYMTIALLAMVTIWVIRKFVFK